MNTLVLSTLLFHGLGTVTIMLGAALGSILPERRAAGTWELVDASAVARSVVSEGRPQADEIELPRAA